MVKKNPGFAIFLKKKKNAIQLFNRTHPFNWFISSFTSIDLCEEFNFSFVCLYVPGRALNLGINLHRTHGCFVSP